ncbi:DUF4296 domain-containing protein [Gracilimonas halophila]|uniref:DUF4296 domain-containing protein n=1 Tax=Gracilimonas halophila TaxID=1834464 RepID=A0ABW5JK65_9BACT
MAKVLSKRNLAKGILFGLVFFISYSCVGPEEIPKPKNLLPEDTYIDLLVEVQHVITYKNAYPDSVNSDSLTSLVYDKYQVTEEEFLSSHEYYQKQVKEQVERIDEALLRLRAEDEQLKAHMDSVLKANTRRDSIARADSSRISAE